MPSWGELLQELESLSDDKKSPWLNGRLQKALQDIGKRRGDRNVIMYASAFLQKPNAPPWTIQLTPEEINGFMSVMYGMDWSRNLTVVLHTPGGVTNAAETVVSYLWSKFEDIEVIVPTYAMSAGTMISLSANRIVMGRQSQLGPIDPQIPLPEAGRSVSARAIVEQFEFAQEEIVGEKGDLARAHVWAPVLQKLGPALLQEAQNALQYGELMVKRWLRERMFAGRPDADELARAAASHFNDASTHRSHGRRVDRDEARQHNIVIEDLEADNDFQDAVLTAYHLTTLLFEKSPVAKLLWTDAGKAWLKNLAAPPQPAAKKSSVGGGS